MRDSIKNLLCGVVSSSVGTDGRGVLVVSARVGAGHGSWLTRSDLSGDSLTSLEGTSLLHELVHGQGWLDSGLVHNWLLVDDLVDGDGGVDDLLLENLSLDDWLDGLVDVVVGDILSDGSDGGSLLLCWEDGLCVLVGVLLCGEGLLGTFTHLVGLFTVLDGEDVVLVDLWVHDSVGDRLDSLLVVVHMVLSVLNNLSLLSNVLLEGLLDDGWSDSLVGLRGTDSVLSENLSCGSWDVVRCGRHVWKSLEFFLMDE